MKRAVIYARYSCDSQTEQSIEGQLHVCTEYAKSNDILILGTYIDRAKSGTNDRRPDFQRMLADCKRKEWDYVLVYKLDRFSRDKYETAIHKKTLKDNGVKVISATEYIPDSPEAIILESMLEGYAEYYSKELSQKINRGLRESRRKGLYCGGGVPYGYKVKDKKIHIEESEAEVVRYIYERYAVGTYVPVIIEELKGKGITKRGKPFYKNCVYNILANERYSGIYTNHGEVYDNIFPRIVPQDLFDKVQAIAKKNHNGKRSIQVDYLLKGKLKCGYCGMNVTAETGTSKMGRKCFYYKCSAKKRKIHDCELKNVRKDILEKMVLDEVVKALMKPEIMQKIIDGLLEMQEKQLAENQELRLLQSEKQKVELALGNIMAAIERGIMSNTTNKRLHELETQQEELEKKIIIAQSQTRERLSRETIKEYYQEALEKEPRLLINILVKEIQLYNDKMTIIFNNPIQQGPDGSRDFCFYKGEILCPVFNFEKVSWEKRIFYIQMEI